MGAMVVVLSSFLFTPPLISLLILPHFNRPIEHHSNRTYREERMKVLESVARRFRLDDVEARFFL